MRLGFLRTVGRWRRICYSRAVDWWSRIMRYSVRSTAGILWHVFKDISLLLSALLFSCQGTEQELKRRNVSG